MSRVDLNTLTRIQQATSYELQVGSTSRVKEVVSPAGRKYTNSVSNITLRFGYWKELSQDQIAMFNKLLGNQEIVLNSEEYDDDCGYKYSYKIQDKR